MKYAINISIAFFLLAILNSCKVSDYKSDAQPVSHKIWDELLQSYVDDEGLVNYKGFIKDSLRFNEYINILNSAHPNKKNWSREEQLSYWINAYNAYTVQLIIRNYPVSSIKDIKDGVPFVNTVWDIKFINIENANYDLNNIEHGIIRPKFKEPRIHFAINCASASCAPLRNEAYTAEKLETQLEDAAKKFINNPSRNEISEDKAMLSKYFTWFKGDFTEELSVIAYINQYADVKINEDAAIDYLEYNWQLNEQ